MARRLTKIVTRSGDSGNTGLAGGSRVPKESPRIEAIGAVDELNSWIGMVIAQEPGPTLKELLQQVQQHLFDLGAELALPGNRLLDDGVVEMLESRVAELNQELPPLNEFVLPGGTPASASCHLARAVCRRAERRLWQLSRSEEVTGTSLRYLNRLSDVLFVIARTLARAVSTEEPQWQKPGRTE